MAAIGRDLQRQTALDKLPEASKPQGLVPQCSVVQAFVLSVGLMLYKYTVFFRARLRNRGRDAASGVPAHGRPANRSRRTRDTPPRSRPNLTTIDNVQ